MFGFFGGKKDKPKRSAAADKRVADRKARIAAKRKKEAAEGAARKKKMDAARAKQKAAGEARRKKAAAKPAAKKTTAKPRVTGKNTHKKTADSGKTASYTNTNRRAQASSKETGGVRTKAGNYPVYKKKSAAATSFRTAFANARKSGYKTFTWEGKKYNTKTK